MGCGGSKSTVTTNSRSDSPFINSINVPDVDTGCPKAAPPPNNKDDIYKPSDYASLDARINSQVAQINSSTYAGLINTVTAGCTTDLQKLRAIFVWLYLQDVHGSFYNNVTDPNTPRGYMKLIKTLDGSYESFFALLCRNAGLHCNVIRGVGKGDNYLVGEQDVSRLESAWNAVYVADGWRLVHPMWAFFQEKHTYEDGIRSLPGTKRDSINEFFWLTDPHRLICSCLPRSVEWQLLKTNWDQNKFLKIPHFTEDYFDSGLTLSDKYTGLIHLEGSVCVLDFEHGEYEEPHLNAKVDFETENGSELKEINKKIYSALSVSSKTRSAVFRFPVRGRYFINVFGGLDSRKPKIVQVRAECVNPAYDPQPFPGNQREGFGLLQTSNQFGISDPVPDNGIVLVRPEQLKMFTFTALQKLEIEARLMHIKHEPDMFDDAISTQSSNSGLQVSVTVPNEAHLEFALQIAVRPEGGRGSYTVVAAYLLVDEHWNKKRTATVPASKVNPSIIPNLDEPTRKELIAATKDDNITRLENAIVDFIHEDLADNGDLTRAREMLYLLHLENLRKATAERKLEDLDSAIDLAHKSHVEPELADSNELADAEMTRQQLGRIKLYLHKVMALNKATIAEIHSYQRPRPLVHQVMKATFRILGEPNSKLQNWAHVQSSMRRLGRNSMLARIRRCDVVDIKQKQVDDAEFYLDQTNRRSVRICSAGASTFYMWSNNMISEYHGNHDNEPQTTDRSLNYMGDGNTGRKGNNLNSNYTSNHLQTTPRNQSKNSPYSFNHVETTSKNQPKNSSYSFNHAETTSRYQPKNSSFSTNHMETTPRNQPKNSNYSSNHLETPRTQPKLR